MSERVDDPAREDRGAMPLPAWEMAALFALGTFLFVLVPDPLWRATREESHLLRFVFSYLAVVPAAAWRLRRHRVLNVSTLATAVGVVWAAKLLATVPLYHLFATSRRPDVHAPVPAETASLAPSSTPQLVQGARGVELRGVVVDRSSHPAGVVVALCDEGLAAEVTNVDRPITLRGEKVEPALLDVTHDDTLVVDGADGGNHVLSGAREGITAFSIPVVAGGKSREIVREIGSLTLDVDGVAAGTLLVFDHPWHVRADADGRFELRDVPLGAHRLCAFGGGAVVGRDVSIGNAGLDITLVLEGSPS